MVDDRTSSADPASTLRLLWRHALDDVGAPTRGPRRTLSVDAVVEAAIALADEQGLDAVTMRPLARRAGGDDDQRWWQAAGPLLARVLDEDAYPLATRIGTAAGAAHGSAHDPDHAYDFGLARVLDAVARLAASPAEKS